MAVGGCSSPGVPVIGCYLNPDKRFAFVEFRNVEEASNAMAFDGVGCQVGARAYEGEGDACLLCVGHPQQLVCALHHAPPFEQGVCFQPAV